MIKKEQAQAYIESKKLPKVKISDLNSFSEKYRILGLITTQLHEKYKRSYYSYKINVKPFTEQFGKDPLVNPWKKSEGKKLAKLLFGETQVHFISQVWDLILIAPYQNSYNRRSFRSKPNEDYTVNKITYFQNLYQTGTLGYAGLTIMELAQYDAYNEAYYSNNAYLFAAALSSKEHSENLYTLIRDIFQGEDEIGGVTRALVKGLLLTNSPKNWKLVEDLLLAAQRQEGLRQTILESLDETSVRALRYFIKVILDHNLMRFSSVIRAVDTWFGFGWEAPKSATIRRVLELCILFFEDKSLIENALKSEDNLEVYVALWCIGLEDVDQANLKAIDLINTGKKDKKILACMFITQTERTHHKIWDWINPNFGKDLEIDFWILQTVPQNPSIDDQLFKKIKQYGDDLPTKGKSIQGQIFSWVSYTIKSDFFYDFLVEYANKEQTKLLAEDISKIPSEKRQTFLNKIFPDHYTWSYNYRNNKKPPKIDLKKEPWKRGLAYQAIKDRNESVMGTGIRLFESMDLNADDMHVLEDLLSRKSKILRESIIRLVLQQNQHKIQNTTTTLIDSSKIDQRLAALEILTVLHDENRMSEFVTDKINTYQKKPKLSKNEQVFLDKFTKNNQEFSFENGFGAVDYKNLKPLVTPKIIFENGKKSLLSSVVSKLSQKQGFLFADLIDDKKLVNAINDLVDIFTNHQNFEYEAVYASGVKETVLLGNTISLMNIEAYEMDPKEKIKYVPLTDVWKKWYEQSRLNDFEMLAMIHYCYHFPETFTRHNHFIPFVKQYIPDLKGLKLDNTWKWDSINKKIHRILSFLYDAYIDHNTIIQFKIDVLEDMIARMSDQLKTKIVHKDHWNQEVTHWCDIVENLGMGVSAIDLELLGQEVNKKLMERFWDLRMYLLASKLIHPKTPENMEAIAQINPHAIKPTPPPVWTTVDLFKKGFLNEDDLKYQILVNPELFRALDGSFDYRTKMLEQEELPTRLIDEIKQNLLNIELERGDLPTEASSYMDHFRKVEGSSYLFKLLGRLGKETFHRGYFWSGNDSRKNTFSSLIKKCIPNETEEISGFLSQAKESKISKKRWIETALYAPQWANWIEEHLGIKKLEDAIWWFHAHAADYMNAEKETLISRYSNVERMDFAKGAIDINWFHDVYLGVGKQNWKLLHDAAKYISDGNGHRLVKLYSGVMLGEVKIRETLAKINEKRDKDYVRALGLIPLSKANPQKDLLNRYNILQEFLKESKQFGAQRQESEKNAVSIALDNLARNAGYDDSIRFSWAMEGQATQKIMEKAVLEIDNVTLELVVDEHGKADIKITKDGKTQKSIPAKYKKDKRIVELQKNKTYLKKQYSRTRVSLENAMLQEEEFGAEEIVNIMFHPVVKSMLSKLVLFDKKNKKSGFWKEGYLEDLGGKKIEVKSDDTFVIAHPSHLYENVEWDLYQKHAFDHKLIQPFKQIFRELYIITQNEIETATRSERYQGHQIQPKKTIALLRSRGWTVNHEEGLQKVYHKKGYIATMFAMADWFSPADIEAPTLEYISFYSRKDYKPIPLKEIDPVTFSEIMRDIDLVVSVAHVGGVDPEASHSTMEMRAALARETARLFNADNVAVKERHIIINGKLSNYSIHLGSGLVSKNGLKLSIIPVHSQHRGRLFLPFIDDDPKSAEIISKMKLLSEDDKIKDPTILAQINS